MRKNIISIFIGHITYITSFVLVLFMCGNVAAQKKRKIEIINAENMYPVSGRLIDNVILKHKEVLMYCDSAHVNNKTNSFKAYGNVHMNQGDTLHLYGDSLRYNGNTSIGNVRGKVKLVDKETVLTTEFLDFNTETSVAEYFNKGVIVNNENVLKSVIGYYYANQKEFFYKDSVILYNDDYTMYTDSLKYNTKTATSYFNGPTHIYSKEEYSYCENGWYNTNFDTSELIKNALVKNKDNTLKADTIYFDKQKMKGYARNNITIIDSVNQSVIRGHSAKYQSNPDKYLVTKRAMFIKETGKNDSLFLHADTLYAHTLPKEIIKDTIPEPFANNATAIDTLSSDEQLQQIDTLDLYGNADTTTLKVNVYDSNTMAKQEQDTVYREVKLYHGVRFWKKDLQGVCDSLFYSTLDSIIEMHDKPVMWSDKNQMSADYVEIFTENNAVSKIVFVNSAIMVNHDSLQYYNQIGGKNITAFVKNNEVDKVIVDANSQTLFFNKDDGEFVSVNNTFSDKIWITFKDGDVYRIKYDTKPKGQETPIQDATLEQTQQRNFVWYLFARPLSKFDLFRKTDYTTTDKKSKKKKDLKKEDPEKRDVNKNTTLPENLGSEMGVEENIGFR